MAAYNRDIYGELPPDGLVGRWTARAKQAVLAAIEAEEITRGQALRRWRISVEEMDAWLRAERRAGRKGLHAKAVPPVQERLL